MKRADFVTFTALGKPWTLRMVPSAWIELEDAGLGTVQQIAAGLQASASFKTLRHILLAGLRFKHPEVTEEEVVTLADDLGSEAMLAAVTGAIQASFPAKAPEGNAPAPETAN